MTALKSLVKAVAGTDPSASLRQFNFILPRAMSCNTEC